MKKSDFYIQEAIAQIEYALLSHSLYETALAASNVKQIFYHLHHLVLHSTNIDKLLFPHNNDFRKVLLQEALAEIEMDMKAIRRLRNHLEHFDERLDRWVQNYVGQPFFDCNLVTGTKGFPEKDFLRALDGNTYKFYGEDFDLQEIVNNLTSLLPKLNKVYKNA